MYSVLLWVIVITMGLGVIFAVFRTERCKCGTWTKRTAHARIIKSPDSKHVVEQSGVLCGCGKFYNYNSEIIPIFFVSPV